MPTEINILVEVLDEQLNRVGIILPEHLDIEVSGLNGDNGRWALNLSSSHPMVAALRAPGSSLTGNLGSLSFSGPTLQEESSYSPHEDAYGSSVIIVGRAFKS